jgi:hypothetical protein
VEIFERLLLEWQQHRGEPPVEGGVIMVPKLSEIAGDIGTHISSADQWLAKIIQEHVPALLALAHKYENSPVVQALDEVDLPPEVEQQIAAIITTMGRQYPVVPIAEVTAGPAESEHPVA